MFQIKKSLFPREITNRDISRIYIAEFVTNGYVPPYVVGIKEILPTTMIQDIKHLIYITELHDDYVLADRCPTPNIPLTGK